MFIRFKLHTFRRLLATFMVVWWLAMPNLVYAQEIEAVESPSPNPEITPPPEETITPTPTPEETCNPTLPEDGCQIDNTATVETQTESVANTSSQPLEGDVNNLDSGEATASATSVNQTNVVSDIPVETSVFTLTPDDQADLNLDSLLATPSSQPASAAASIIHQDATITTQTDALAISGQNQLTGLDNQLDTADATALATGVNLTNIISVNTPTMVTVVNILPDTTSNLILPRLFTSLENLLTSPPAYLSNFLTSTSTASASAISGQNYLSGSLNFATTGEAVAYATNLQFANLYLQNQSFYYFLVNLPDGSQQLYFENSPFNSSPTSAPYAVDQVASTETQVTATAISGQNQLIAQEQNNLQTGNAYAAASQINLTNLTATGSRIFIGIANVFGNWLGKTVFAYPDLTLSLTADNSNLTPGSRTTLTLTTSNLGYDTAPKTQTQLQLPSSVQYLSDNCQSVGNSTSRHFPLGDLGIDQNHSCQITVAIDPATSPQTLKLTASTITLDEELDTTNNSAHVDLALSPTYSAADQGSPDQPLLSLQVNHNVNDFIRPLDTVSFEVKLKNLSPFPIYEPEVTQTLTDPDGAVVGTATFPLSDLEPQKTGTLRYGIVIPDYFYSSQLLTVTTEVTGHNLGGDLVSAPTVTESFWVKPVFASIQANRLDLPTESLSDGQILGATETTSADPVSLIPHLIVLLCTLVFVTLQRRYRHRLATLSHTFRTLRLVGYLVIITTLTLTVYSIQVEYQLFTQIASRLSLEAFTPPI